MYITVQAGESSSGARQTDTRQYDSMTRQRRMHRPPPHPVVARPDLDDHGDVQHHVAQLVEHSKPALARQVAEPVVVDVALQVVLTL